MTVSNIGIDKVLSDPFGKTASQIIDYLLQNQKFNPDECRKLIKGKAKNKSTDIISSIEGYTINSDQHFKLSTARAHLTYLDELICDAEVELFARTQPHYDLVKRLSKLPGFSELSSSLILAEIGTDMNVFESSKHLVSWAGLAPANNESAGKKKSVRISKAGQYLKPLLIQCALSAIKSKKEPYFAIKYNRIKKRRGHKKAIIAIARMLLTCIYHMIKTGNEFNPIDYQELNNPKPQPKQVELNVETALQYLASQGIDISVLTPAK